MNSNYYTWKKNKKSIKYWIELKIHPTSHNQTTNQILNDKHVLPNHYIIKKNALT